MIERRRLKRPMEGEREREAALDMMFPGGVNGGDIRNLGIPDAKHNILVCITA
jgi:hypothetical protein